MWHSDTEDTEGIENTEDEAYNADTSLNDDNHNFENSPPRNQLSSPNTRQRLSRPGFIHHGRSSYVVRNQLSCPSGIGNYPGNSSNIPSTGTQNWRPSNPINIRSNVARDRLPFQLDNYPINEGQNPLVSNSPDNASNELFSPETPHTLDSARTNTEYEYGVDFEDFSEYSDDSRKEMLAEEYSRLLRHLISTENKLEKLERRFEDLNSSVNDVSPRELENVLSSVNHLIKRSETLHQTISKAENFLIRAKNAV